MDYKKEIQKHTALEKVERWLENNPKPPYWQGDKYSWAFTEMPIV